MQIQEVTEQPIIWLIVVDWSRHGRKRYYAHGLRKDVECTLMQAGLNSQRINALSIHPTSKPLDFLGGFSAMRVADDGTPTLGL